MPFAAAAVAGGALVGAGATMYAANKQSKAVANASNASIEAQNTARDQTNSLLEPYRDTGYTAMQHLQGLSGSGTQEQRDMAFGAYQTSPGYQFAQSEGQRAIEHSMAAKGLLQSGATAKALQERGIGLASQDFNIYYNRLAGLAQMGQNSAANTATAGMNTATNIGNTLGSAATAQANITGNMAAGIGGAVNNGLNNYSYMQGMQQQQQQQPGMLQQNALMNGNFGQGAGAYPANAAGPYLGAPVVS